jgi:hypothetical protein
VTVLEWEEKLTRRDKLKQEVAAKGDEIAKIEEELKEEMGDDEERKFGAYTVTYKFSDTVGKINEDRLLAYFPGAFEKYCKKSIDVKALSRGDPHAYNECLICGAPVRRLLIKADIAKLVAKTEKRVRKECED